MIFRIIWMHLTLSLCQALQEDSMSIMLDQRSGGRAYIRLLDQPKILNNGEPLTLMYRCETESARIGLELRVWTAQQDDFRVYRKTWMCESYQVGNELRRTITIKLPDQLAYKPSSTFRHYVNVDKMVIFTWIMNDADWQITKSNGLYSSTLASSKYSVEILPPYERPEKDLQVCLDWWSSITSAKKYVPQCPLDYETLHAVNFPVALSGTRHGVHKQLLPYRNKYLEAARQGRLTDPQFTITIWLYIYEYCDTNEELCSIMTRITWDDNFVTPLIFLNKHGNIHTEGFFDNGDPFAFLTNFAIPKRQWVRLVLKFKNRRFETSLIYGNNFEEKKSTFYVIPGSLNIYYDDTQGLHVFGGSEAKPAFKGYIGDAVIYRGRFKKDKEIPLPSPYHPMFELELTNRDEKCAHFLEWVHLRIWQCRVLLQDVIAKSSCPNIFYSWMKKNVSYKNQCPIYKCPRQKEYEIVRKMVRQLVFSNKHVQLEDIGQTIYDHAINMIDHEGFSAIKNMVIILKQASCYGNHDATFMLSAILNNGVAVKTEEAQSHSYLMQGALDNNRLCLLTLGNRHMLGLDGMPHDHEMAYVYYKNVADRTRNDKEEHREHDLMTELVRLTDEEQLSQQTDEDGDLFNWFKHQAGQGVVSAQQNLARLLFWGSQGIKRNLGAALEYYRTAAESNDPVALYDYGIVLLKGQGTKKNIDEGVQVLEKSAEQGNPAAMNTLGWHALEYEKNNTKAMYYFERSFKGGNPDAAHNLGHMYMEGKTHDGKRDKVKAWHYFSEAAVKGQFDSALMVALYNMRGHPLVTRNTFIALAWCRWLSEKNPAVGKFLSRGLKAYRKHNWPSAILYYLIASETGTEVAHFNLAYLCEENQDGLATQIGKDCIWRHYNLSVNREPHEVVPYSLIKMGDYFWYGCRGKRDIKKAVNMYTEAAIKGDPQAIFNLAFLVEEGVQIDDYHLQRLGIPSDVTGNNVTLLTNLYSRCKDSRDSEAHFPCLLALYRVQFYDIWERHHILVKLSTFLGAVLTITVTVISIYHYFHGNQLSMYTV